MAQEKHTILGGKVHVYRRENSRFWQCSTYLNGKNRRASTKEESLGLAKEYAEDWYLTLRGKQTRGELPNDRTFAYAAGKFLLEFEADTLGERNPKCLKNHQNHIRLHLNPFLGRLGLAEITTTKIQEYRLARMQSTYRGKHPAAATIQKEIVTLRMVLKAAVRQGWLDHMPDMSAPYRGTTKVSHRAWFSPEEYKTLYTATRANAKSMTNGKHRHLAEQLHDKGSVSKDGTLQAEYAYNYLGHQVIRKLYSGGQLDAEIHSIHDPEGHRIAEYEWMQPPKPAHC